ncbi:hypothetical protein KJ840_04160 [Patescibacteria group bacterium]|nr:hypothetical protein [Patescibacteria group bacterium]
MKRKKNRYQLNGFTLIEAVVVLGLMTVILFIIYGTFLISHRAFSESDQRLELIQNGRVFLDRISRELRQSVDIATPLPAIKNDPLLEPPNEIMFQDGHGLDDIQYLRYYLDSNTVKRQRIVYYFPAEPSIYVSWNTVDEFGNPPDYLVTEEKIIAEYLTDILYYGAGLINIEIYLEKYDSILHLFTAVWGRNES